MNPTLDLVTSMMTELGSDTTMLAGALFAIPIKTPFTPDLVPTLVDADMADFAGSAPKATGAAVRPVITDPNTGDLYLNIPPPAGGFFWVTTSGANLPQTIYGVVLSSDSTTVEGGVLMGSQLLNDPVPLNASGQGVDGGDLRFTLVLPALS